MLDIDNVRRTIREGAPEQDLASLHYLAEGWDYELWETEGGLLFRVAKREECVAPLRVEARLLGALADELSLPVPRPVHVAERFFSYHRLPGTPLEQSELDEATRAALLRRLGGFLSELHRFPVERARALGVPCDTPDAWREDYRRFAAETEERVGPLLSATAARAVRRFWHDFLADECYLAFEPVLTHADLDGAHVLVDEASSAITGIIDWGDARVSDPALDFAGFDAPLRRELLAGYALPVDETLEERAAAYRDKISPFHAVLYGLTIDDRSWVERGVAALEAAHAG